MATYPKFSDVGGNERFKSIWWQHFKETKNSEVPSVLLHGPTGCGKSLLARSVAGEYQLPLLSVEAFKLAGRNPEGNIQDLFHRATQLAPCILLIENIESLTAKRSIETMVMDKIFIQLATSINDLKCKSPPVLVICTTSRPDLLDKTSRTKCFNIKYAVRVPNKIARESILQVLCKKQHLADDVSLSDIAGRTHGYVGSDLKSLISLTISHAMHRVKSEHELQSKSIMKDSGSAGEGNSRKIDSLNEEMDRITLTNVDMDRITLTKVDIQKALADVKPSLYREDGFVFSNTTWDDLKGMDNIRRNLKLDLKNFQDEVRRPEHYGNMGVRALLHGPSGCGKTSIAKIFQDKVRRPVLYENMGIGVLLYGPSGCGKTSIAKAIANDFDMNLLYVRGGELMNKHVRESEKMSDLFKKACRLAPCVIFFDQIDAICPKRPSGSEEGSASRVTVQLLLEMSGLRQRNEVYIMAATNELDCLDPALLRPGRINKIIYVGLPSPEERVEILKALTKNCTRPKLADDIDLDCLGKDRRCNGFSGADLEYLLMIAKEICCDDIVQSRRVGQAFEMPVLNETHFEIAFEIVSA